jgi:hypothetical protein
LILGGLRLGRSIRGQVVSTLKGIKGQQPVVSSQKSVVSRGKLGRFKGWLGLWGGALLLLAIPRALAGDWGDAGFVALQVALAFVAASLLRAQPAIAAPALFAALAVLLLAAGLERWLNAFTWQAYDERGNLATLLQLGYERIEAPSSRRWSLSSGTSGLLLSFEARWQAGMAGWNWHRSEAGIRLEPRDGYAEVFVPHGPDPYLMRDYCLDRPLGGMRVRARVTLRADEPVAAQGARGIWLQAHDARGYFVEVLPVALAGLPTVALGDDWREFVLEWTVPEEVTTRALHLVLNDFDGVHFAIRDATVELYEEGAWQALGPPAPVGVSIGLDWPGRPAELETSLRFFPTIEWQRYTLKGEDDSLLAAPAVQAALQLEPELVIDVRDVQLSALPGEVADPRAQSGYARLRLWFGQPNLAGHSILVIGLVFLSVARLSWLKWTGLLVLLVLVGLSGSRAAWLAALIALPWLLWRESRLWLLSLLIAAGLILLFGLGRLQGFEEVTSRPEIWQVALQAVIEHPWTGLGTEGFADYWRLRGSSAEVIPHAHNFWLDLGTSYGLLGIVAGLWIAAGLLAFAWRRGGWRGLGLVVPVLLMNLWDATLFYAGVLLPLLLGLNLLASDCKRER